MKRYVPFFLLLIIIVLGFLYLNEKSDQPEEVPRVDAPLEEAEPIDTPIQNDVASKTIQEETDTYTIRAVFPSEGPAAEAIGSYLETQIENFKRDASSVPPVDEPWVFQAEVTMQESSELTTYLLKLYTYTGGIHGYDDVRTFTFDQIGNRIMLDDLFTSTGYLPALSEIVADTLYRELGDYANIDMIRSGTAPAKENFERFYATDTALVFLFSPYAVAPYAAGTVSAEIPVLSLQSLGLASYW